MRGKLIRPFLTLAAAALAVTAGTSKSAAASPVQDPIPIGPNEFFTGLVNGHPPGLAFIDVVCPGPVYPGETGRPLGNQTVEVEPAAAVGTTDLGYTGSASSITALLVTPSPTTLPVVIGSFTSYFVKDYIPTNIRVPCSGSGVVRFVPSPASAAGRAATLQVIFVDIAV